MCGFWCAFHRRQKDIDALAEKNDMTSTVYYF